VVQKRPNTGEKRRRGRPRAYDPDRALANATDIFWKKGYAATSLDDLAEATGMNRPSIYAAFGDKADLYLKTLQRYRHQYRNLVREQLVDDPPLRVALERFYDLALDIYLGESNRAPGCYVVSTAATQAALDPTICEFLAETIRNTDTFLSNLIAKARDRGEIDESVDTAALAQLATATLHTLAVRSRAGASRRQLSTIARASVDMICKSKRVK
jgi:TetR/AcrR family transcriptional regulator, copper-responsive repressor